MIAQMDPPSIVRRRLHAQRLASNPCGTPAEAVAWLGAMQAQEYAEAKWSIGQRVRGCTDADVEAALARGEILRTHLLRPTWHFVAAADIRWMLTLTAPRVHGANRYWYRRFALDETVLGRSREVVAGALAPGEPLTRAELADALRRSGIEAGGLRLGYLLMHAELEALMCSGPRRSRQHTYALLAERCGPAAALGRGEALAELTRRFFRSRGPATVNDLATWSGLTLAGARAGLDLVAAEPGREVDGSGVAWFAASAPPRGRRAERAFLIPMYDEMVMGNKDLKVALDTPPPRPRLLERPIVIDGLTVGSWRRSLSARAALIHATLFRRLVSAEADAREAAVARFGRFNERPGRLEIQAAPII